MAYVKKNGLPRKKVVSKYTNQCKVGTKFGKWTVISDKISYGKNYEAKVLCKCKCGNEKSVLAFNLVNGLSTGCYCNTRERGKRSAWWKGYEEISGAQLYYIKSNAKRRGLEYQLTPEILWNVYEKQNKVCALSGISLTFSPNYGQAESRNVGNASLDRIDSSRGYVADNIQWVDTTVNFMKSDLPEKKFIDMCCKIASYSNSNPEVGNESKKGTT